MQVYFGRECLNLHEIINVKTLEIKVLEAESVNDSSKIKLLKALKNCYALSSVICLIFNIKYHYLHKIRDFLKESQIELAFLSTYSPNLNSIKILWNFFKKIFTQ